MFRASLVAESTMSGKVYETQYSPRTYVSWNVFMETVKRARGGKWIACNRGEEGGEGQSASYEVQRVTDEYRSLNWKISFIKIIKEFHYTRRLRNEENEKRKKRSRRKVQGGRRRREKEYDTVTVSSRAKAGEYLFTLSHPLSPSRAFFSGARVALLLLSQGFLFHLTISAAFNPVDTD